MQVHDFIQVEISSLQNTRERRIDELLTRLHDGDVMLVAELSRLGRNMFDVKLIFVRQPELYTAGPHRFRAPAVYSNTPK